jgi:hypothetical protein
MMYPTHYLEGMFSKKKDISWEIGIKSLWDITRLPVKK